ncbi:MAG: 2-C-methyl-D-erythritol 4-phosphate cytidylyltransferase [Candidatus Aminicenantaceae bacterium]
MEWVSAIIVAAGEGKRFGSTKQYSLLKGKPVLEWTLERFEEHDKVDEIILVLKDEKHKERILSKFRKIASVVRGGKKRQDSVFKGFSQIDPEKAGVVLIHDGVRPLVENDFISRVIEVAMEKGAAIPAIPVEDTVKEVSGHEVLRTLEREKLYRIQTPQGFLYPILNEALEKAREENYYGTDEASLVERTGKRVFIAQGDPRNIKITTPEDLKIVEALLES